MHHAVETFIQDLAVIMLIAGVVTVLFNRFKQPVVLGYIVAGVIIGPHTPPFSLITDERTIQILAELGVIFLLFSLGLEFSLKKLAKVGATAFVAALAEITLMLWIGYEIGIYFGWKKMDAVFLGAMLSVSSTTIIVKALNELGMKREKFAQLIFGILIVEDVLAIGMIALLSGVATSGSVDAGDAVTTIGKLVLFMIVSLVAGILVVPRLLDYVARFKSKEMLLVTVLGLCFGFCLLVMKMEYSVALGAFLIGAVMAESRHLHQIERLIEPVRDMFSAIFFVAIGLLFNPSILAQYWLPIAVITVAVVLGKVVSCGLATFLSGQDGRTSMRVGMGLSQIGEFSFIIAALGVSLKVTSDFLYPTVVAVSAVTTLLTPYLIKLADPLSSRLAQAMPNKLSAVFGMYSTWLASLQPQGDRAELSRIIRRILLQVVVNLALVAAIFIIGGYFADALGEHMAAWVADPQVQDAIVWGGALLLSLPFLIATYRKLHALSMLLAEISVKPEWAGSYNHAVRRVIAEVIPVVSIVGIMLMIAALSSRILPPTNLLILVLVGAAVLVLVLWQRFVKLHSKLQIALRETLEQQPDEKH
ncbi:cation:proton antiporter [Collimonas sp. PA-H2]|uniref:cation:proton antiporter n=1 Tax=Collimonas sp. PA-H2 TaxID=1881062 RepID=UPI000BF7309F|nr:cation:proton antiporter [Collimonas sp. PA-H2]